jgi:hypothetical protein
MSEGIQVAWETMGHIRLRFHVSASLDQVWDSACKRTRSPKGSRILAGRGSFGEGSM